MTLPENLQNLQTNLQNRILYTMEYLWTRRKKIGFYSFLFVLLWNKDIGWEVQTPDSQYKTFATSDSKSQFSFFTREESEPVFVSKEEPKAKKSTGIFGGLWAGYSKPAAPKKKYNIAPDKSTVAAQQGNNLANTFTNLTFKADNPNLSEDERAAARKKIKQLKYVERYAKTAQTEMEKFGIPASITLAQGLLESNVGESRLATQNNNHFGIKCFSRKCKKGHCANYTDDSHKDFFRKYKSNWESFRAHSKLLQAKRYRPLYKLDRKDYKAWAHGLKKAGYATDKKYAYKIIQLIEDLGLYRYDA